MRAAIARVMLCALVSCSASGWAQTSGQQEATPAAAGNLMASPGRDSDGHGNGDSLPDSPGTIRSASLEEPSSPWEQNSASVNQQSSNSQGSSPPAQAPPQTSSSEQMQSSEAPQKPVGTAVAEPSRATGIAASQPAGEAIAPAKQRRARTIVLRVGAIVAAGAAVGTVVALSEATPSKPPGAR